MRVLVIGGTHFIGREIVRQLADAGHEPILFNRGRTDPASPWPNIHGDVEDLRAHREALLDARAEALIHCIANTEKHAEDLAAVFAGQATHLIALSSQDCYEAFQGVTRHEERTDLPYDEDAPLSSVRYYKRGLVDSPKAAMYDKNLMTQVLLDAGRDGRVRPTVFRLPMVYGPHDYQTAFRHGNILHRLRDRRRRFVMGLSEQGSLWTHGYVENIAAGVIHALGRVETHRRVYNLGERQVRSRRRWADLYAREAGFAFEYQLVPDELLWRDAAMRNHPAAHLIADCNRYALETGFADPVPLEEGLRRTIAWAMSNPEALGKAPDYEREERLVEQYDALIARMNTLEVP